MRTEYWFARRFPVGNPRAAVAPINATGRLVTLAFVCAMVVGAISMLSLSILGLWLYGIVIFVSVSAVAGGLFLMAILSRTDRTRTVEDYRRMETSPSGPAGTAAA